MGRKNKGILLLRFLLIFLPCIEGASRLNEYIHDYETLEYDPLSVHESHLRVKRWIDESGEKSKNYDEVGPEILLKLRTKRKNLLLRLKRDTSVFSSDLAVELDGDSTPNNNNQNNLEHIYAGHVDGVAGSNVFGSIREGIFDGKVITPDETFYVQRANKYSLPTSTNTNQSHSVIYSEKDVHDPFHEMRTGHSKGCGITDEVMEWMERIQNSAENDMPELKHPKSKALQFQQSSNPTAEKLRSSSNGDHLPHDTFYHDHNSAAGDEQHDHSFAKYYSSSSSISRGGDAPFFIRNSSNLLPPGHRGASFFSSEIGRGRRALRSGTSSKTTCTLSIQTDPLLWKHISEQERTDDENKIREEILSLIGQHVKAVNHIYSNTLFDGKEPYKNIRFEVQRIKIDTDKACKQGYKGEKNLFCIENIDVSNFLNLHSLSNHEDFCLSYVFTYRDFTGGTLGLAWVASASGASGGVCEKYKTYTETIGGVYQSTRRSLNTGIITFVNYNSRVPPKVSQLTLAHEIGHNFGSPHDYPSKCRPGGPEGNFIMFASATSGDRPNNSKFSDCSMRNVSSVLDAIIHDSKKTNCFIATNGTFCGNKIVEEGEMCDCGYNYEECEEECCYPRQISDSDRQSDPSAAGCRRKPKAKCSPSEGPCCDSRCMHVKFDRKQLCKQDTECSLPSYCSGRSAQCPTPTPKEDLTPCNNGTQVCQRGECQGSICLKFGLQECFLSSNDKNVDKRKLCDLACLDKQGRCRSTSELQLRGLPGGLSLRPGAPCDNFQGYCDVFLKCRSVDAEGPLARLKNLLFNKETLLNIAQWVTSYWWAVLLMGVAFIIIMGLFIKHTPSSNPKKAPHRRIGDTLRRPINTLRRHRHYRNANSPSSAAAAAVNAAVAVNGSCPPPPYSAGPSAPPQNARAPPPHGYGEGRGPNRSRGDRHHDRQGKSNGKSNGGGSSNNPYAGAFNQPHKTHQQHRV